MKNSTAKNPYNLLKNGQQNRIDIQMTNRIFYIWDHIIYKDNFTSIPFISFSYMIVLARIYSTMVNRSAVSGHPCLVLILEEKLSAFHHWGWSGCGCVIYGFILLRLFCCMYLLYSMCWAFLIMKWCTLSSAFLHLLRWSYDFFHYFNVVNHIYWFVCVEPTLNPRDKSSLVMVNDPFNLVLNSVC